MPRVGASLSLAFILPFALAGATPAFDVATVKPSPPPQGDSFQINLGTLLNGTLSFTNVSLSDCLKYGYGIEAGIAQRPARCFGRRPRGENTDGQLSQWAKTSQHGAFRQRARGRRE